MNTSSRRLRLSFIGPGIYFCITIYSGERLIRVLWDTLNHDKISWSNLTFTGHRKNVSSSESGVLGWVQTGATTPNIVAPTMLGVVACVLAVVCKRMQQLPTSLGPAVHRGKNTTHRSLWSLRNECAWPLQYNGGRTVQTQPSKHGTTIFFLLQSYSKKTLGENAPKGTRKY